MEWLNRPPQWQAQNGTITVTSGPKTDFWRKTHYGFLRDSGHFYGREVEGDFTVEVRFQGEYEALYDQAGLMLRVDETTWMKCGIEYVEGMQYVSAVVTRDFSDWSVAPLADNPPALRLRVTRRGPAVEVHYARDEGDFALLRIAYLAPDERMRVGIMCASPEGEGFTTTFEGFTVRQP